MNSPDPDVRCKGQKEKRKDEAGGRPLEEFLQDQSEHCLVLIYLTTVLKVEVCWGSKLENQN